MVADDRSNPKNWLGAHADADTSWLAMRAADRPAFLASALAQFLELRRWTPQQLAQWLRCASNQLANLGLCRRPDPSSSAFEEDLSLIVTHFQLDYWNLRRLLEALALPGEERQQLWKMEDLSGGYRRYERDIQATGDFTTMFGEPPRSRAARQHRSEMDQAFFEPREGPVVDMQAHRSGGAASPRVVPKSIPAGRQSCIGRLLSAIRNFFSKK